MIFTASTVVNSSISFLLIPVLTRYLNPGDYGKVALFQSVYVALSTIVTLETVGAATRKYFDTRNDPRTLAGFITACLQVTFFTSIIVALAFVMLGYELAALLEMPVWWLFVALLFALSSGVTQLRLGQWQARGDAIRYSLIQLTQAVINVGLSVYFIVVLAQGGDGRVLALTISAVVPAILSLYLLDRDRLLNRSAASRGLRREALHFGIPLLPHSFGSFLFVLADRLIIVSVIDLKSVGIYSVAAQISLGLGLIFNSVKTAYEAWLFEKLSSSDDEAKQLLVKRSYYAFLVIILVVICLCSFGPAIIDVVAGPAFAEASTIIGWLAISQGFTGMYMVVVGYLFYERRTSLVSICSVTTGIIGLALTFFMARCWGIQGVAAAVAVSTGLRFVVIWWAANRCHPLPWFSIFRPRDINV